MEAARPVKPESGPTMVRGAVYSTTQLAEMGIGPNTIAAWKRERGLIPLDWGTKADFFLSDDIIDMGRKRPGKGKRE